MDSISFNGKLAKSAHVNKLSTNKKYKKVPVAFVELSLNSQKDFKALKKVVASWALGDIYANDVYQRFKMNVENKVTQPEERFFVLTTQQAKLSNLKPEKILGVAELYKPSGNKTEIEFLQANPKFLNPFEERKITGIGKAMIASFLELIKDKEIVLFTTPKAQALYEKFGFKNVESNYMVLER